jgi:hypothetical protein
MPEAQKRLLDPARPLGRSGYWIAGVLLFGIKHAADRLLARQFGRPWTLFNYVEPSDLERLDRLTAADRRFYASLLAIAVPFIAIGVILTMRRLGDARLPRGLVALFFVPFVNLLFFLILSVIPSEEILVPRHRRGLTTFERILPDSAAGGAIAGVLVSVVFGTLVTLVALRVFQNYGWGLFVGVPFSAGLVSSFLAARQGLRLRCCIGIACLSVTLLGLAVVAVALEGLICVLMAAPIAYPIACLGGWVGYAIQSRPGQRVATTAGALLVVPLALPGLIGAEKAARLAEPEMVVRSIIEIDAPPERVWDRVVHFDPLPPPKDLVFLAGVSYPLRAEIRGEGKGALRRCVFSTGAFIEPIEVWDEPRRLAFLVAAQPRILTEMTPYREIHPPHLDDFFVSTRGEFLLTRLPGGRTRLLGTTWYRHAIWPVRYWRLWSDAIIHAIHMRVLEGIKSSSEADRH